jgi:hypothetical protein
MARREYNRESKVIRREDFISSRLFLYSTTSTFSASGSTDAGEESSAAAVSAVVS